MKAIENKTTFFETFIYYAYYKVVSILISIIHDSTIRFRIITNKRRSVATTGIRRMNEHNKRRGGRFADLDE